MADVDVTLDEIHPGEILGEEFLLPLDATAIGLAEDIGVPADVILDLVAKRSSITAELAERLASRFKTEPGFWMNLQAEYDRRTMQTPK